MSCASDRVMEGNEFTVAPQRFRGEWFEDETKDCPWIDEIGSFPTLREAEEASKAYVGNKGGTFLVRELQMLPPGKYLLCDPRSALREQPEALAIFYESADLEKILVMQDGTYVFAARTGADGIFVNYDCDYSVSTDTAIIAAVPWSLADNDFDKSSVDSVQTTVWTGCRIDKENEYFEMFDDEWPTNIERQMLLQGLWTDEEVEERPDPQVQLAEAWVKSDFRMWLKSQNPDASQAAIWTKKREATPTSQKVIYQLARSLELLYQGGLTSNDIYNTFRKGYSPVEVQEAFNQLLPGN